MLDRESLRVVEIDLAARHYTVKERPDLRVYLGGVGLATALFAETADRGLAPLAPSQPVVLAIGPLTTVFPLATKTVAVFRSPLTGEWGESYAGMRLAFALRFAGYDAVVITGRAENPTYLVLSPGGVAFRDARGLWGLSVDDTGRLLREWEPGRGHRSIIRIGPAGERGVAFAGVNVDTFRHFGRLGLGAVFGSKNLKAVVVHGELSYPIRDPRAYREAYGEIYERVVHTDILRKYHGLGTPANVSVLNGLGALPTRNLQASSFEKAAAISGEAFAAEKLTRKLACTGCPVGCIHIALLRRQFAPDYEYESVTLAYDYELIYALGSLLGIGDPDDILRLIEKVELLGLDAITTGVLLAWATEACAGGLLPREELGADPSFGGTAGYLAAIENLVTQPNDLYRTLARGLAAAVRRYGGEDFALLLGGHEMAGYHTGYGYLLGHAVGARHSHLCNDGYGIDQKLRGNPDPDAVVRHLLAEECWRNVLNSLCICLFARGVYDPPTTVRALRSLGLEWDEGALRRLGREILKLKVRLKSEMGFNYRAIRFARRFFETPALGRYLDPETARALLARYCRALDDLLTHS
ncbi:MAG: aldehyde ferredoxin oxidoreductase N-terminal domain-containing protein [Bacillota bacterium]